MDTMDINYIAVLACAVLAMGLGAMWYGPLFGKQWMRIIGATDMDVAARKAMQKNALPLYLVQFVLVLFQVYVLAHFIRGWSDVSWIENVLWVWAAFVMPTVAAGAMWSNDSRQVMWARFLIQAGYYLVLFLVFGFVLSRWT